MNQTYIVKPGDTIFMGNNEWNYWFILKKVYNIGQEGGLVDGKKWKN